MLCALSNECKFDLTLLPCLLNTVTKQRKRTRKKESPTSIVGGETRALSPTGYDSAGSGENLITFPACVLKDCRFYLS